MKKIIILLAILIGLLGIGQAEAVTIYADMTNSSTGIGDFTAELTFDNVGKELTLEITNNNDPLDEGGAITGIAFNNPGDYIQTIGVASPDLYSGDDFHLLFNNDKLELNPFGAFDIALFTEEQKANGKKQNITGGTVADGIAAGATERYVFALGGANIDQITSVDDFLGEYSDNMAAFFIVRFQGFADIYEEAGQGSDKVPGTTSEDPGTPGVVPEPASIILAGLGFAAIGFTKKK